MNPVSTSELAALFDCFIPNAGPASFEQLKGGHINLTYKVRLASGAQYILQAVNANVFPNVTGLMENVFRISAHLEKKLSTMDPDPNALRFLRFVPPARQSASLSDDKWYWRVYHFIDGVVTRTEAKSPAEAYTAAKAFGRFQSLLADLPEPRLNETIPNFHNTCRRFEALEKAISDDICGRAAGVREEIAGIRALRDAALEVQCAYEAGLMPERTVHNDAKFSNILLDSNDGHAVCIIDLDTCMPGLSLHDFGDLVRSMVCFAPEDEKDVTKIRANREMFSALCDGFLSEADSHLTPAEHKLLRAGGVCMTSEVAVRMLTDYLQGDTYFRIAYPEHNLVRARSQMTLARSILDDLPTV